MRECGSWRSCVTHRGGDAQELDARHRRRARCENRIKTLKNTGPDKFPFKSFAANHEKCGLGVELLCNLARTSQKSANR